MDTNQLRENYTIYISGPITGDPNAKERFAKAQEHLEKVWTVINPFEIPGTKEIDAAGGLWEEYMKKDIAALVEADFIYMLHGWRRSRGARLERKIAKALKIGVLYEPRQTAKKRAGK